MTQAIQKANPQRELMDFIERQKEGLARVATKHLTPEKLLKYVGLALSRNPKLADCSKMSVLKCVMTASQLGLDPSGTLGGAYLIPFKDECTLIIGYRGLVDLIRRYCDISVEARAVFRDEVFDWSFGTEPKLVHKPGSDWTGHAPSLTHVYVVFTWPDGRKTFEVMTRKEVDRIRFSSKNGSRAPWADDGGDANEGNGYVEMAKKTVVRRGIKLQPLTTEAQDAIGTADEADGLDIVADVKGEEVKGSNRLAERIEAQRRADAEADEAAAAEARAASVSPGPDGDAQTRATEQARPQTVKVNNTAAPKAPPATRRNTRSPESLMHGEPAAAAAKPAGKVPNNETFADDDLAALDNARDIERE